MLNFKYYRAKKELSEKHPYKSDNSIILTNQGSLSVTEADIIKKKLVDQLFKIFANAVSTGKKSDATVENIQIALSIYSSEASFKRYIAFDRTDGTPLIIEKSGEEFLATQISYNTLKSFLNDLMLLSVQSHFNHVISIGRWHNYSIEDLLCLDRDSWHNYILPAKKNTAVLKSVTDNAINDTTIDDLLAPKKLYAVYNGKDCVVQDACSHTQFKDYVATVTYNDSTRLVDIRDFSDIYEKEFYIELKGRLFKVALTGKNYVIVDGNYGEDHSFYGFKHIDSHDIGPGWEVDTALIDSVKFKKKSVISQILKNIKY